ncbi:MAG: transrane transport protein (DitE-like protein) [Proteobacteria bacterium]|nr:transrane transport protein (DitE-like protein) [Pseudomonadota bacterium]
MEGRREGSDPAVRALPGVAGSPWSPFRHSTFTVLWIATLVSNIGTWMQNAAAGWLMTGLNPDPLIVALVQVATSLPMFLFVLPAGALADILDRRHLLLVVQIAAAVIIAILSLLVWTDRVTPFILLAFTFLAGSAAALISPAWQAIVPQLVPRQDLPAAVALNSAGFNASRAVGPALAGLIIAAMGLAAPFCLNAISYLGVIAALFWWHAPGGSTRHLPAERFGAAIRTGLRHARHNPHLRATLSRASGFFLFASAYWALLPLVARNQVGGGPELYGILLGVIGAGAVGGALALPWLKSFLGADKLVAGGTIGTAVALVLFGLARQPAAALVASVIAGVSWIAVIAPINVSAQLALPEWVRGRGLAVFAAVLFGGMTVGSALWGQVAVMIGLPGAHFAAAAAVLAPIPLLRRWKLQAGVGVDLMPSMHWPTPVLSKEMDADRGPTLVTVEYRIDSRNREEFLAALERFADERRRDGAYAWGIFEDAAEEGRFLETFFVDSWLEHLRQHERVTHADRLLQDAVHRFHIEGAPKVTHFIAAAPAETHASKEKQA